MKVNKNKVADLLNIHSMVDTFKPNEIKPDMVVKVQKVIDAGMKKNPKWNPEDTSDYQGDIDDALVNALVEIADQLKKRIVESNNNKAMAKNVKMIKELNGGQKISVQIVTHIKKNYKVSAPLLTNLRLKVIPKLHMLIKENKEFELDNSEFQDLSKLLGTDVASLADEVSGIITAALADMDGEEEEEDTVVIEAYQKNMEEGVGAEELVSKTMEDTGMPEEAVKKILLANGMMEEPAGEEGAEEGADIPVELTKKFNFNDRKLKVVGMTDDEDPVITMEGDDEEDDVEMKLSKFNRMKKYSLITEDLEDNNDGSDPSGETADGASDSEIEDKFDEGKSYKLASGKILKVVKINEAVEIEGEEDEEATVVVEDEHGEEEEIPMSEMEEMGAEEFEPAAEEEEEEEIDESFVTITESKNGIKSVQLKTFSQVYKETLDKQKK